MTRAQHKFVTEKFGLKSFALVVGGSMGAQQTYKWAVRYPDMRRLGSRQTTPKHYRE